MSAFAADAVVRHAVFSGTVWEALREEWRKGSFTMVLDEIPELRDRFEGGRFFLRKQSPLAQGALLGLVLAAARHPKIGAALALPYAVWILRRRAPVDMADQVARDLVCSVSLLVGSAKTGRILL
jgi:hypothetical protein